MFSRRALRTAASGAITSATREQSSSNSSQVWITIACVNTSKRLSKDTKHRDSSLSSPPLMLRVPMDDTILAAAAGIHGTISSGAMNARATPTSPTTVSPRGALQLSRRLLAPHHNPLCTGAPDNRHPRSAAADTSATNSGDTRGPYDVSIDEALQLGDRAVTVRALVRLLVDPDIDDAAAEDVLLHDFVAMAPKRQLRAVQDDGEALSVLLGSEAYQREMDARALRLRGVTSVGQWNERPDVVALTAYGRGLLSTCYQTHARVSQTSQTDSVMAWLTRTIQRAVAEEMMAPRLLAQGGGTGSLNNNSNNGSSSLNDNTSHLAAVLAVADVAPAAPSRTEAHSFTATSAFAAAAKVKTQSTRNAEEEEEVEEEVVVEEEEEVAAPVEAPARGRKATSAAVNAPNEASAATSHRGSRRRAAHADAADGDGDEEAHVRVRAADVKEIIDEVAAEQDTAVDAEMAQLMAEAEAVLHVDAAEKDKVQGKKGKNSNSSSPAQAAIKCGSIPATAATKSSKATSVHTAVAAATADEAAEDEEEVVVEEEVVEEEEDEEALEQQAIDTTDAASAAAATSFPTTSIATTASAAAQSEKLVRLADLMLRQFNTADGYLHPVSEAERVAQSKHGDILVLDDDTAQVDPLAMFSAYHAATVTESDPVSVRALKTVWTAYNRHQTALEEATSPAMMEFCKHESVNALLYGSVLLRALAREEAVVVLEGTAMPEYGFPLVSSDTRLFTGHADAKRSVTNMTPDTVTAAMQAYKTFFSDKARRFSPFRPLPEQNAGCCVVRLSGTTIHLYYTSMADHVKEEEVRLPFAEVLLGMLHVLRQKILPRVNVVHYHLIATKLADPRSDTDFMLRSTATLDMTVPFTNEEHTRLKALAAPLGMSEEMDDFRCIDDLVLEIEDNSGASVVHSLLHNREDLEATLTATLAQLLPEDEVEVKEGEEGEKEEQAVSAAAAVDASANEDAVLEEEEVEEIEEEEEEKAVRAPARKASTATVKRGRPKSRTSSRRATLEEVEDLDGEEEGEIEVLEEEAEVEDNVTAITSPRTMRGMRAPAHRPAPPAAPKSRRTPAPLADDALDGEEAELEEAINSQWQQRKQQQQQQRKVTPTATASKSGLTAAASVSEEWVDEEIEEEEEKQPTQPRHRVVAKATKLVHGNAYEDEEELVEEMEEEEEEMETVMAPVLPKTAAGRRAVPVVDAPAEGDEEGGEEEQEEMEEWEEEMVEEEEEEAAAPSPVRRATASAAATVPSRVSKPTAVAAEPVSPSSPSRSIRRSVEVAETPRSAEDRRVKSTAVASGMQVRAQRGRAPAPEAAVEEEEEAVVEESEDQWFRKPKRR